ncbi:hypothetical protein SSP24_83930 [Streptomyces spinoverrucosus]|uniref:HTH tetR-type domain-containing protein n=1 Tax=Streptomyces spinoverrucosus TaxID=284043 RepID=A0A4Y3VWY8_9ACTN|nr:TetR/AcrR family transcriptional regulator [Streptomyces spinoverrucosus]GEC10738.1 hypothetical protein SSP24_83930 [Streptomyces spinoverrucosus]GHB87709.1 hypothetical protein GCM10010397_69420 [Streptomyces spinoverrucosus]
MQERAARTHRALILAAAEEFDRLGYEGASLARISRGARASMGALTFHFATKSDLAAAVRAAGRESVAPVVRSALGGTRAPLEELAELTFTLVRLLEHDVVARATARLERERPRGGTSLALEWVPALRLLLERASAAGQLRPGVLPETAAVLLTLLIEGAWAEIGRGRTAGVAPGRVWELVLHGVSGGADK